MCESHPHYFIILYHGSLSLALFIISLDANIPNIYFTIFSLIGIWVHLSLRHSG